MAVQQNKKSRSKRGQRRSHDALTYPIIPTLSVDPETGEVHIRHHITPDGYFRGRRVLRKKK